MTGPSPEFERIMGSRIGETDLTVLDVYKVGEALLNWTATTAVLGHTRPGHTLDYLTQSGSMWSDIVRDFVAWTSSREVVLDGASDERLRAFVNDSGWTRHALTVAASP